MLNFTGPVVCAVIGRTRHKMMQAEIQEAAKQGAKLIELRLDFLAKPPDFKRLLENRPCPMIATFRRQADGGRWTASENQRLMLIRQAIVAGFDLVDLEIDIIDKIPRFGKVQRIVSYHNVQEVPEKLELIHQQMCAADADIMKIVVTAQKPADNVRVMALLKKTPRPTIAFCMGDLGTCSRVLGLRLGMPFTYAAFNKERQIAPGMLSYQYLQRTYQIESVNAETKVFGVIGDPVSHSLSPLIHNAAFRHLGVNAIYVPFRVPRGELAPFLQSFQEIPVDGYSVTVPHKEAAAKFAQEKDDSVATMGAANTLLRTASPGSLTPLGNQGQGATGFRATNTDAQAALDSLRAHLPLGADNQPVPLAGRNVIILGAGGVARAVAHALHKENVPITITNRTPERGQKLASEIGCRFVEWTARHSVECDTLINCTSVGMHPNLDETPVHHSYLKAGLMVFETVYTPETTMLIREARARGCHVLTGVDMFVRQAGLQFELFTGQPAPLELMIKLVREALSPVRAAPDEAKPSPPRPVPVEQFQAPAHSPGRGAATPLARPSQIVYLIGYRGTGKTSTARRLADKLGWSWLDADEFLQARHGRSIREIFAEEVEKGFRDKEAALLQELSEYTEHIIATGGGVILREENRALLKQGTVVWLHAPADVLWQRLQKDASTAESRPDLAQGGLAEIEELLRLRAPLYEECHDLAVNTAERSPEQVAEVIFTWLREGDKVTG
jgi:3-dehydroquinate dehydratase/shikimate dehydrogenase